MTNKQLFVFGIMMLVCLSIFVSFMAIHEVNQKKIDMQAAKQFAEQWCNEHPDQCTDAY